MLRLRVAPGTAATPIVPSQQTSGVEVWRHTDGSVIALGGAQDAGHWMQLVNVGLFVFGAEADLVTAYPDPGTSDETLADGFRRMVLPMALQVLGHDVLHASAVLGRNGVLAFCAASETGKSTLAYAFARRGYRLWADDAVAFQSADGGVTAVPLAFTLRLRAPTTEFYGLDGGEARVVEPSSREPLAAVCVLERVDQGRKEMVERLRGADAFPLVLAHAYCFSLADESRKARMTSSYLDLVTRTPVFRVRLRTGLQHLPALVEELDGLVGIGPAAP